MWFSWNPGSPAWAGIDLIMRAGEAALPGFPRVGGDRPSAPTSALSPASVPPRGRG